MKLIKKEAFVCLDCETTGLDIENDKIIEVGAAVFNYDGIIDQFEALVDPKIQIPEASIKIHNISQDMVAGQPTIDKVLPSLIDFLDDYILVGHGITFDIGILINVSKKVKVDCSKLESITYVDTLRLARLYGESLSNSLSGLCQHFGINTPDAHRAMGDVLANIEVFKLLASRFKTVDRMLQVLEKPIQMKQMPFGKYKGRSFRELPDEYLKWTLARMDLDKDLRFSISKELKTRKTGGLFSQATNPFRTL